MAENRTDRNAETREKAARIQSWRPAQLLPDPDPVPGYKFRWVRVSTLGQSDPTNLSSKLREGWEPVRAADHPEMQLYTDQTNDRFKDNIIVGGLMLCKTPTEFIEQRNAHFQKQADGQMQSVDNSFMRENDPRMPLFKERSSKTTFGRGT